MRQPVESVKWMAGHEDLIENEFWARKYLGTSTPVVVIEVLGLDERLLEFCRERHGGSGLRLEKHEHSVGARRGSHRLEWGEVRSQEEPGSMAS